MPRFFFCPIDAVRACFEEKNRYWENLYDDILFVGDGGFEKFLTMFSFYV